MEHLSSIDFSSIHRLIVEIVLLILVLIGAYKLIKNEWPKKKPPKRPHRKKQVEDQ